MIPDIEAEKPMDKLKRRGPEALTDAELLSVIFRTLSAKGAELVRDAALPATNRRKSPRMVALAEYAKRQKDNDPRPLIDAARSAVALIPAEVRGAQKEHFVILCLNARRQLVHQETVSIGTLSASLVHPREVFGPAIRHSAAAVVCVHNHPSGDPTPSAEDRDVTRRLQRAGELLGIPLADHVVVSAEAFFSFREHGLL